MSTVATNLKWDNVAIRRIIGKGKAGLIRMGFDIANLARSSAPYDTGALTSSVRVEEDADDVLVIAGGKKGGKDIRYAAIQEFGGTAGHNHSVHITGKHYMERAVQHVMSGDYLRKYFGGVTK